MYWCGADLGMPETHLPSVLLLSRESRLHSSSSTTSLFRVGSCLHPGVLPRKVDSSMYVHASETHQVRAPVPRHFEHGEEEIVVLAGDSVDCGRRGRSKRAC